MPIDARLAGTDRSRHTIQAVPIRREQAGTPTHMWRWLACDLKTGRLLAELLLAASGTVSRVLCGTGNGTFRLPLTDPATPEQWWQATLPGRTLVVGDLDEQIVWAGIVWTSRLTDNPVVELGCQTIESYLSRRWVDWTIGPLSNVDQHQAARTLIAHANTSGIDLQVDAPLSGIRRARLGYRRWADQRVGEQLDALHELPYGIEWTIDTAWTDHSRLGRRLVHTVRVRTPRIGAVVDEPVWVFEYPGNITAWELVENHGDGSYANVVVAGGRGQDEERVMSDTGAAQDTQTLAFGAPLVEHRALTDHTTIAGSNAAARQALADLRKGTTTLSLTAKTDRLSFGVGWSLGDTCRVQLAAPWLPRSYNGVWRIVGWDLDPAADTLTPTLAVPLTHPPDNIVTSRGAACPRSRGALTSTPSSIGSGRWSGVLRRWKRVSPALGWAIQAWSSSLHLTTQIEPSCLDRSKPQHSCFVNSARRSRWRAATTTKMTPVTRAMRFLSCCV